jgi:hypothetical protein
MSWIKAAFLTGLLSSLMINFTPDGMAADWARGQGRGCQRGDRLNIQDLDMSPDPVTEGQRIRSWRVRVNFAGQRDCETDVMVREGNNIVGHARNYRMRPGLNELEIPVVENFRYTGREQCFNVQVDLDGSRAQVDAARRFCARQRNVWSMREPDDRGPPMTR